MTSCGESSDGLAPKKPITSRQPPNRNRSRRPRGGTPRPQLARGPTRGEFRHVHPLTTFPRHHPTFPLQHPTFATRIPGRRWRLAGRRLCRPQRRALPCSSGSPSDPAAASVSSLPATAHRRGRHETPGRCRRTSEATARRGISSPTVNRLAPSVRRSLGVKLRNRQPNRGPLADTHPATKWGNRRAVHTRSGYGPTNWFRCAESLRVADGVSRCSRPRSDW